MTELLQGRAGARLFALVVVAIVAYHLVRLSTQATLATYVRDLNVNDTFYYYQIAKNLAAGKFSTFDGVELTNGYHPLWAWLLAPFFLFDPSPDHVLAWLKNWELILLGGATLCAAAALRTLRGVAWFMLPVPFVLLKSRPLIVGMEGACAVLVIALTMWLVPFALARPSSRGRWLACAIVLGALPYARLELVAATVVATVALVLYVRRAGIRPGLPAWQFATIVLGLVGFYFLFSQLVFGLPVPVSGLLKRYWSERHFEAHGGYDFVANLGAMWDASLQRSRLCVAAALLALPALSWLDHRHRARERAPEHGLDIVLLAFSACLFARFAYAVLTTRPFFALYDWYFAPTQFLGACLVTLAAHRVYRATARIAPLMSMTVLLVAVLAVPQPRWTATTSLRDLQTAEGADWELADYHTARWMQAQLPKTTVVGSTDAGIFAFFTDLRVINLDGLVNSADFYRKQRDQELVAWVHASDITHLANVVHKDEMNRGCRVMARRMRQRRTLRGRCTLVHEGGAFGDRRSVVWRYDR
jgi:hypothetical protein